MQKIKVLLGAKMPSSNWYPFNANPKQKKCGDCVIRAISVALDMTWEDTIRDMTEFGIKKGYIINDQKLYPLYLKEKGFIEMKEPRSSSNLKMSVNETIRKGYFKESDVVVANVGSHHVVCIKNKMVLDTWDSTNQTMHKYWIKGQK